MMVFWLRRRPGPGLEMAGRSGQQGDHGVLQGLTVRLLAVLGLLAALALADTLIFQAQSARLADSAHTINLCGRQRVLSQRAGLLARALADAGDAPTRRALRRELETIAEEIERHLQMLGEAGAGFPAEVRTILEEPPHRVLLRLEELVAAARSVAAGGLTGASDADLRHLIDSAERGELLASLDEVLGGFERQAEHSLASLRRWRLVASAVFLAVVAAVVFRVFRPMLDRLRRHLSELRQAETRLRQRQEELKLTFEHAPLGVMTCDVWGRLQSANPALLRALDRSAGELLGRPLRDFVHPEDYEHLAAALRRLGLGGDPTSPMPVRLLAARGGRRAESPHGLLETGGRWVPGRLHGGAVHDEEGRAVALILHFEDRTRQVQMEEEARQHRERLAHVARQNTVGETAAGIAHEINQPLSAISTYAQACKRLVEVGRAGSGELRVALDKVSAQAQRAGEVIRRLRTFVGRRPGRVEPADLNELVREALALVRTDSRFDGVPIRTELAADLPRVAVDTVQIQQVILNLVRNGLEAAQAGGQPLRVHTLAGGDGFAEVAVVDRGAGLPEGAVPNLFTPFFTTKPNGLGMGLSISRSIVDHHGGRIWFTPNPAGGTIFHFTVPIAAEATEELNERPTAARS